jgi:hypothetical protein
MKTTDILFSKEERRFKTCDFSHFYSSFHVYNCPEEEIAVLQGV